MEAETVPNVRWSWEQYPQNRIDGTRMVIPLGCLYTPLSPHVTCPDLPYDPLKCPCGGVLNPFCVVDHRSKLWACCFCNNRNAFPPHYASMNEHSLPMELLPQNQHVEYVSAATAVQPTFAIVIDTVVDTEEELSAMKESVLLAISKLPEQSRVCLVTYGATIQIHDLSGKTEYNRSIVLRGSVEPSATQIQSYLSNPVDFVCPLGDCEFIITSIIEDIDVDYWPVAKNFRPLRCTGAAVSTAANILHLVSKQLTGHVLVFMSGVCTEGPGQVIETTREKMIRSHKDLAENNAAARFFDKAVNFYDTVMRRMVTDGHSLNVFSACLDQTGVAELKACVQSSGGVLLMSDSWGTKPLRTSLLHFFDRKPDGTLRTGGNATIDVLTSPTWKVMGVIGPCIGTGAQSRNIAETEIGMGGTCQWACSAIDSSTTFSIHFETAQTPGSPTSPSSPSSPHSPAGRPPATFRYAQVITKYQSPTGARTRVSTLRHLVQDTTNFRQLADCFDQEAAAVILARIAVHKTETSPVFDVMRWIDRNTVRLVSRFGEYQKDQPGSLRLPARFSLFPSFMFHLRRSAYLQVFNSSPDETAWIRFLLLRASCNDAITMIHPALYAYSMQAQQVQQPVLLDTASIQPDNVLLLDTFFEVLIHHGETIAAWRKAGYEENPEYAYFKEFLVLPRQDAEKLEVGRYPAPRMFEVCSGDPGARILHNRINPSKTHNTALDAQQQYGGNPGELIYTDDVSLQTFMDHLKKLAVQQ